MERPVTQRSAVGQTARKMILALGLAAIVGGAAAGPALAHDDEWRGGWRGREGREHEWRRHEWREHEWREHHGYYRYGYAPGYVYAPGYAYVPPPVVYAPPVYAPPSLSFVFPLR
jgi:hypothetical protein